MSSFSSLNVHGFEVDMFSPERFADMRPCVDSVIVVRDDETGWAHVAYDIDPRRKPRLAGFVLCESERALLAGMTTVDFRLASAYRVDAWSTAFIFCRITANPQPGWRVCPVEHDDASMAAPMPKSRSLRLVQ